MVLDWRVPQEIVMAVGTVFVDQRQVNLQTTVLLVIVTAPRLVSVLILPLVESVSWVNTVRQARLHLFHV